MSLADRFTTKTCGVLGCGADAEVVIDHPEHGERTVCGSCAADFEVVRDV
ncbi:hypothetical protein SAMN05216388_101733 [Halorientalis persicus]|uniref:Uncharacterized protein n=1 Tax=Halorientalis persicus TaxID=1367881 RepID=A0A1H8RUN8_9EURY|nr:hypothetical protein [Halorientalis persicus]SEO69868.1 hypothetical protein SAMN05216388_101733 [Halorientalis persicus]